MDFKLGVSYESQSSSQIMPLVSFLPPEHIKKHLVFLGFHWILKDTGGMM